MSIVAEDAPVCWSPPSKLAARAARIAWGEIQFETAVARGVYHFSTAGHGGLVAVIGVADIEERFVEAARKVDLTEVYTEMPRGRALFDDGRSEWRGVRIIGPETPVSGGAMGDGARASGWPYRKTEVWVGEEDCAYATILLACPVARAGFARRMADPVKWLEQYGGEEHYREVVERWHPEFLRAAGS